MHGESETLVLVATAARAGSSSEAGRLCAATGQRLLSAAARRQKS
jgi:hypothetical protein